MHLPSIHLDTAKERPFPLLEGQVSTGQILENGSHPSSHLSVDWIPLCFPDGDSLRTTVESDPPYHSTFKIRDSLCF